VGLRVRFREGQKLLLGFNLASLVLFGFLFAGSRNSEFLFYESVILFFIALIGLTDAKVLYPKSLLWGLTLWAQLHLAGGGLFIGGRKLYEIILLPVVGAPYHIFRYDQFVHIVGFGVCTILAWHLVRRFLENPGGAPPRGLRFVIVLAGLGFGALNEIVEFGSTVVLSRTGVGGYENNAIDLVADLVGALLAIFILRLGAKRTIVTAAVIEKEGRILLAQRGEDDRLSGYWEFPGGKVEPGESTRSCLAREIREELGIEVEVREFLCASPFDYDHISVELLAYRCRWVSGEMTPNAHQEVRWILPEGIADLNLAPADRPIAEVLRP
jgi:mutator protein MutT